MATEEKEWLNTQSPVGDIVESELEGMDLDGGWIRTRRGVT